MARNITSKRASSSAFKSSGRCMKSSAASALTQAPIPRSERSERTRSRRAQPSADELGMRAWKTTYKNSRNNGEA